MFPEAEKAEVDWNTPENLYGRKLVDDSLDNWSKRDAVLKGYTLAC